MTHPYWDHWRYVIGSFASGQQARSDQVLLSNRPIGTFSTGQHGAAARHRRPTPAQRSVRMAFADVAARTTERAAPEQGAHARRRETFEALKAGAEAIARGR